MPTARPRAGVWILFLLALVVAVVAAPFASTRPDGLDRVAEDHGLSGREEQPLVRSPLAEYSVLGHIHLRLSVALSGVVGVTVTAGVLVAVGRHLLSKRPPSGS